jgi:hypothetical protein
MTYVLLYVIELPRGTKALQIAIGPGAIRTLDLGIKSPAKQAAASCTALKEAANRTTRRCNKLQRTAACGDKHVRASVHAPVYTLGNAIADLGSARSGADAARTKQHRVNTPPRSAHSARDRRSPRNRRLYRRTRRSVAPHRGRRAVGAFPYQPAGSHPRAEPNKRTPHASASTPSSCESEWTPPPGVTRRSLRRRGCVSPASAGGGTPRSRHGSAARVAAPSAAAQRHGRRR